MMSNAPKKNKDVQKQLDEYVDEYVESELNYYEDENKCR